MPKMTVRRSLLLVACALVGGLAALIAPVTAGAGSTNGIKTLDTKANLPDPVAALQQVQGIAPYTLHMPTPLPQGAIPLVVDWEGENGVVAVDMWWSLPDRSRFHVWQTNDPNLVQEGKDPTVTGTPVSVGGVAWSETPVDWGLVHLTEVCRKFEDGVTVCASSDREPTWVLGLAATIV